MNKKVVVFLSAAVVLLAVAVIFQSWLLLQDDQAEVQAGAQEAADFQLRDEAPLQPQPFDPGQWDPFQEMNRMQQEMDRIFENAFSRFNQSPRFGPLASDMSFMPRVDFYEDGDEYVVEVELPGADEAQVDVTVEGNTLRIEGRQEAAERDAQNGEVFRQERRVGSFQRSMTLPGPVDPNSVTTDYEDGVYTVRVKKA